jgi:hypothetical protein
MSADRDIVIPQLARNGLDAIFVCRIRDPEQIVRQQFAETAMDLADGGGSDRAAAQASLVKSPLLRPLYLSRQKVPNTVRKFNL